MSFEEFKHSLMAVNPPPGLSRLVQALWRDAQDDWDGAHNDAQADNGRDGSWVHAYLHRKEGDLGNAGYWYARAGRPMPEETVLLTTEWEQIARELLTR